MAPNVIVLQGQFIVTADVKVGGILLHNDFALGLAARDIKKGEVLEFKSDDDTEDVIVRIKDADTS